MAGSAMGSVHRLCFHGGTSQSLMEAVCRTLLLCPRLPLPVKAECLTDHCLPAQACTCQNGHAADPFFSPTDIPGNTIRFAPFNI